MGRGGGVGRGVDRQHPIMTAIREMEILMEMGQTDVVMLVCSGLAVL